MHRIALYHTAHTSSMSEYVPPNPVEAPPHVHQLLSRLHRLSTEQERTFDIRTIPLDQFGDFMRDKFVALEQDKCAFVYQLIRATGARNVVEVSRCTWCYVGRILLVTTRT